jgi:K+-transporting ATPase KdpF subunit
MTADDVLGLAFAIVVTGYLVVALIRPEKIG